MTLISFVDSSKDSSLQSDTSIESEDSFASVIFIPKPNSDQQAATNGDQLCHPQSNKKPSVPTSPLILPCPPTPMHSPAPIPTRNKLQQSHNNLNETTRFTFEDAQLQKHDDSTLQPLDNIKNVLSANKTKLSTTVTMTNPSNATSKITTILTPPTATSSTNSTSITVKSGNKKSDNINLTAAAANNSSSSAKPLPKITRQTIKDLPPIPKFKHLSSFPIVRRISATKVVVPKLMSLELFNPETDDLDSDSSEPSSPDSIDSVINALQPTSTTTSSTSPSCAQPNQQDSDINSSEAPTAATQEQEQEQDSTDGTTAADNKSISPIPPIIEAAALVANKLENTVEFVMRATTDNENIDIENNDRLYINKNDINLNVNIKNLNSQNINRKTIISDKNDYDSSSLNSDNGNFSCRQHLVDFAEKLSAQLLKELDENSNDNKIFLSDDSSDNIDNSKQHEQKLDKLLLHNLDDPYLKKINGEIKNLNQLREELRERRLMLANLSTMQQQTTCNQIATSNTSSSSKKAPPQMINFIPELDENDEDEMPVSTTAVNHQHNINSNSINIHSTHDTALLIQEEDSSDEHLHNEIDNSSIKTVNRKQILKNSKSNKTQLVDTENHNYNQINNNSFTSNKSTSNTASHNKTPSSFESNNSCESWANSNSTASLDSPSVGGSATHHRYYHVFREGELDALINHHVASLHIVSSYYERASWCVVCEKVQVWTI